jgi:hypothetical protein
VALKCVQYVEKVLGTPAGHWWIVSGALKALDEIFATTWFGDGDENVIDRQNYWGEDPRSPVTSTMPSGS